MIEKMTGDELVAVGSRFVNGECSNDDAGRLLAHINALTNERDELERQRDTLHAQISDVATLLDQEACKDGWGLHAAAMRILGERDALRERVHALKGELKASLANTEEANEALDRALDGLTRAADDAKECRDELAAIRQRTGGLKEQIAYWLRLNLPPETIAEHIRTMLMLGEDTPAPASEMCACSRPAGHLDEPDCFVAFATVREALDDMRNMEFYPEDEQHARSALSFLQQRMAELERERDEWRQEAELKQAALASAGRDLDDANAARERAEADNAALLEALDACADARFAEDAYRACRRAGDVADLDHPGAVLLERVHALESLLRSIEWSGTQHLTDPACCPACNGIEPKHEYGCDMHAILEKKP